VKILQPYADKYGEIHREVQGVHERIGEGLSELGVYTSRSDILAEYSQLKRIARKKDPTGKARELLDGLYQSAHKKETYLEDLKNGVRICIEEKRVKTKDVVKATIPTMLEVFFDCIITAISPDIGYWFWLGTTAGFFGYPAVQWGEWVKTNKEVREDLRLLDELRPAQIESILKSIDTYPEKVKIELAQLEKQPGDQTHRIKDWCQRVRMRENKKGHAVHGISRLAAHDPSSIKTGFEALDI
jgi:hypothetical protein